MEEFEGMGAFWLPEKPDDVLTGNLSFDHEKGIRLTVVGDFSEDPFDTAQRFDRIVGFAGKKQVTLDDCEPGSSSITIPGVKTQEYLVERMWLGHHFTAQDDTAFTGATVTFDDLPVWVGRSMIQVSHRYCDNRFLHATAKFERLDSEIEEYERGTLTLGFSGSLGGEPVVEYRMRSHPYLRINRPEETGYEEFLTEISRIQDLITICTDRPCGIRSIHFEHKDIPERVVSGATSNKPKRIEYRASLISPARPDGQNLLKPHKMLLSFDDLGGLPMIGKWLSSTSKFSPVLGALMATRYRSKMYAENRFLNMTTAAESLHRLIRAETRLPAIEFNRRSEMAIAAMTSPEGQEWLRGILKHANEPSLGSRLRKLVKEAKPAIRGLIKDQGKWSMAIAGVRNRLTHLEDMGGLKFDGGDLYWLSESVYDLTRICLLKEVGLTAERMQSLGESAPYNRYSSRLDSAIARVLGTLSEYDAVRPS